VPTSRTPPINEPPFDEPLSRNCDFATRLLIDTVGGTGTLAIIGSSLCILALGFSQVRGLRAASLARAQTRAPSPILPISEGIER